MIPLYRPPLILQIKLHADSIVLQPLLDCDFVTPEPNRATENRTPHRAIFGCSVRFGGRDFVLQTELRDPNSGTEARRPGLARRLSGRTDILGKDFEKEDNLSSVVVRCDIKRRTIG
jgi:hypothetical protein